MPTYQVKCEKCGKVFDELVMIKDRNKIKCQCGGSTRIMPVALGLRTTMYGRENKPLVLEHLVEEGAVHVTTKSQLKRELKKHGGISPILD